MGGANQIKGAWLKGQRILKVCNHINPFFRVEVQPYGGFPFVSTTTQVQYEVFHDLLFTMVLAGGTWFFTGFLKRLSKTRHGLTVVWENISLDREYKPMMRLLMLIFNILIREN
ncbi:hypothetical protein X474_07005 [Dethiosulfatarculus sandiegensis]|uniref:Uncharacterized protein n=1 Tax=Dethiosulfatarculus sandiegensis TaxID=1429043 RepID=A0A0D2J9R5_9BACT|nr:hypothetical protein X474_07005 [Dethiosulfatarculus sandiegensis]